MLCNSIELYICLNLTKQSAIVECFTTLTAPSICFRAEGEVNGRKPPQSAFDRQDMFPSDDEECIIQL